MADVALEQIRQARRVAEDGEFVLGKASSRLRFVFVGCDWDDRNRAQFEEIVSSCIKPLEFSVEHLRLCQSYLRRLENAVIEYESVQLGGDGSSLELRTSSGSFETQSWPLISGSHSAAEDAAHTNPGYDPDAPARSFNCQRCVAAWDMRRRGYDVQARPYPPMYSDYQAYHVDSCWTSAQVVSTRGTGMGDIEAAMASMGDGARVVVSVMWAGADYGHVFVAEQIGGRTVFMDPQNSSLSGDEVRGFFDCVAHGQTEFWRIDNLDVNDRMNDCCERRRDA